LASNTQCLCQERLPKRCAAFDVRCRGAQSFVNCIR